MLVITAYTTIDGVFVVVVGGYRQQVSNTKGDAVPGVFLSPVKAIV